MDMFAPESRENIELYREKNIFSDKVEKELLRKLNMGQETFPNMVTCPVQSCRNPIKVDVKEDMIELTCTNCGWSRLLHKQKS
jgi:hypothetical protein